MAAGTFLTALPHFFQGQYVYETTLSHIPEENTTESILPCLANTSHLVINDQSTVASKAESISINHKDSRWVGAWWLGFLVSGFLMLLAGIPFWFLPNTLAKQCKSPSKKKQKEDIQAKNSSDTPEEEQEQGSFLPEDNTEEDAPQPVTMAAMAKGSINLPAVAVGVIVGGLVMKRFKLSVLGAARLSIISSFLSFCLLLIQYFLQCDNSEVAGLTMTYQGATEVSYQQESLLSQCNMGRSCSLKHWDPVCARNGITYASPCLAGCQTSTGIGKEMEFHNCTCMQELKVGLMAPPTNMSAILGQCPRKSDCDRMFKFYMAVSVLGAFVSACGGTSGYIVLLRSIHPDLKSLALGMHTLIDRTLGGIPPPIYFGALVDRTCLKWGLKRCGGQGACRLYDSYAFRITFLGLVYCLYGLANMLWVVLYLQLSKRQKKLELRSQAKATALEANGNNNPNAMVSIFKNKDDLDRDSESTI
ncbi:solute carrier organic anion transporter family member 1C1 isoform X2 [Salmo salar]|uniref:Solute carrier organic anion transporter family member 1C1-like isoform X2 n=1 Tax=Salmo salar TaxID=8030 RepID=A0ABM3DA00_SALSA|nr:solute carrier organic anion transporter family member 1C1-like isoform X2 [Salmo salar]XP_045555636.1 solute carrier organic anion transporter family member 1C1-like isoform X2 [Salmo salar]